MAENHAALLAQYLKHLQARVRSNAGRATPGDGAFAKLPAEFTKLCSDDPSGCLDLIVRALEKASPAEVAAIGMDLLGNLLNTNAPKIRAEVAALLKTNKPFRQAFANGHYTNVDPDVIGEWVAVLNG